MFLLVAGAGEPDLLGMEEIWVLAAFAKQHMTKSHSVRLSDLDPSQWGCIRKNAGACRDEQSTCCDNDRPASKRIRKPILKSEGQ